MLTHSLAPCVAPARSPACSPLRSKGKQLKFFHFPTKVIQFSEPFTIYHRRDRDRDPRESESRIHHPGPTLKIHHHSAAAPGTPSRRRSGPRARAGRNQAVAPAADSAARRARRTRNHGNWGTVVTLCGPLQVQVQLESRLVTDDGPTRGPGPSESESS